MLSRASSNHWPARAVLALAVLLAYWPVLGHRFGGFDDPMNLTANPDFSPPSLRGVLKYWRGPAFDLYAPLTFTVWGVISLIAYRGGELAPWPFHAANLAVHILAAICAYELLRRLAPSRRAALLGALVFALHPLAVESVAWVSGLKDVLAGMLSLLAIALYLSARPGGIRYALGTGALVLAMLAKPSAVVTPALALLLDLAQQRRPWQRAVVRSLPWFALAIPIIVVGKLAQPGIESVALASRPLVMLDSLGVYLWKLFWPAKLGVDYGRQPWVIAARGWSNLMWLVPLAAALASAIAWRWKRSPAIALAVFVIALAPMLGMVPFDFQAYSTVADHYAYLALIAPALLVARLRSQTSHTIVAALCLLLAILSFLQARTWRDGETISTQALVANPDSWVSHASLASIHLERGRPQQAVEHAQAAARLNPKYVRAHVVLGQSLAALGRFDNAEMAFRDALAIAPHDVAANIGLADALADAGRRDEALRQYTVTLSLSPRDVTALSNLAGLHAEMGQFDEALRRYEQALSIDPAFAPAQIGRARVLEERSRGR